MITIKPRWLIEAEVNESKAHRQYRVLGCSVSRDVWDHCSAILELARSRHRALVRERIALTVAS